MQSLKRTESEKSKKISQKNKFTYVISRKIKKVTRHNKKVVQFGYDGCT